MNKTVLRNDVKAAREILRTLERLIAVGDWNGVESWARDLEARGSMIACGADELLEADARLLMGVAE